VTPTAEDFLTRLRSRLSGRKRIEVKTYRQVFAEILPALIGADFRARLAAVCAELEAAGRARLPRSHALYDHTCGSSLPIWLELIDETKTREPLPVDPLTHAWPPELRFACDIRDPRQLRELLCVQRFLAAGGRTRPLVPAKERSIELFGDEKRLEEIRRGALFDPGRLSLELLRCFIIRPPLVHELAPVSDHLRPLLVIENHSTWHSFVRWNREQGVYAAVVFGSGDSFKTGAAGLPEIAQQTRWDGRAFYFGDIDVKGLLIPLAASLTLRAEGLQELLPHTGCYLRAMERVTQIDPPILSATLLPEGAHEWLGPELGLLAQGWLGRGIRVSQELVGWEELRRNGKEFMVV
jgi:hypothetical protein